MALPVRHPKHNLTLTAPSGVQDVVPLSVHKSDLGYESMWQLTDEEVWDLIKTKKLVLLVCTSGRPPPVWLGVAKPEDLRVPITRDQWYAQHRYCPECGAEVKMMTLVGAHDVPGEDYDDTRNIAYCKGKPQHKRKLCDYLSKPPDRRDE